MQALAHTKRQLLQRARRKNQGFPFKGNCRFHVKLTIGNIRHFLLMPSTIQFCEEDSSRFTNAWRLVRYGNEHWSLRWKYHWGLCANRRNCLYHALLQRGLRTLLQQRCLDAAVKLGWWGSVGAGVPRSSEKLRLRAHGLARGGVAPCAVVQKPAGLVHLFFVANLASNHA